MAVSQLNAFLRRHAHIALDTSVFIYQLEANPRYAAFTDQIFSWLESPRHHAVTSTITMMELLVQPYRHSDERVDEFYALLSTFPNLDWIPPSLKIADAAARIRAVHRLQTADALQAATALDAGASGFVTNDGVFERVENFETLLLERLVTS
ncbi:MAG: PIN domain-containing protein [Acidobacteriaceae bacterium]|nr:PIN domain-containing protein [Acidobacteriaceae bacterium]